MTTELSKPVNRAMLSDISSRLATDKAAEDRAAADLGAQIEKLRREQEQREQHAHILGVKQRAIRAAIRVLEDEGVM